jgi:hypothetical protein
VYQFIHKYTGVHVPQNDIYAQRRDPAAGLYQEIIRAANSLMALEMDIRVINRKRIQLAAKITRYLDAGPADEVMFWRNTEADDALEVKLTSWSNKTEEIRMLVAQYEKAAGWVSAKLTENAQG